MTGYLFAAACAALAGACYGAGRASLPSRWTAAVAAGALCVPAAQFAIRPAPRLMAAVTGFTAAYLVFAALPLLAGRYVAQQRKAAEHERLGERLRIARDMHDSPGRRLSIAAVQAAALEVSELPAPQHDAVTRLATAVRASVAELHEILSAVRDERPAGRGMDAADGLIDEFRAAGAVVSLRSRGTPGPLPTRVGDAAYRVIEEGLTNAIRHAPGQPAASWSRGRTPDSCSRSATRPTAERTPPVPDSRTWPGGCGTRAACSPTTCPAASSGCTPSCPPARYRRPGDDPASPPSASPRAPCFS